MALTTASVWAAVLEQTERTKHCSKAEIARFIEESELKISSLESQIHALIELRDSERACAIALRYIVSPIRTLPVELLAEIFDLTIADPTHIKDVYRISQICSDWRRVAFSTPRLWTRPLNVDASSNKDNADGYRAWLARSAPLTLAISLGIPKHEDNAGILGEVLRVATRWRSLTIRDTLPRWLARQLSQCRLDSLEELDLGYVEEDDTDSAPITFTSVPRLRKLFINYYLNARRILYPWAQLTDLALYCDSPDDAFGVFTQCTNLVTAVLGIFGRSLLIETEKNAPVLFSQLESLDLQFVAEEENITPFFDRFSTPLLQALSLNFRRAHWTQARLTDFKLRAPDITRLDFRGLDFGTSDNLLDVIRHAPLLTHLKLTLCVNCFDDAFIRSLYYEDGVAPMAPRLHDLVVRIISVDFSDEDNLAGMIISRWCVDTELASIARWTRVELNFGTYKFGPNFVDMVKDIPAGVLGYD